MTSKIFSKTVNKTTLWATILAVLVAAAIVVSVLCGGFHKDATLKNSKSVTVSLNTFAYNTQKDTVQAGCEEVFGDLNVQYVVEGEMEGDECEIVFIFHKNANVEGVKQALDAYFAENTAAGKYLEGASVDVTVSTDNVAGELAKGFVLRGVIAGVIFAVLAFGYVAVRTQKWWSGMVVGVSVVLAMLSAAALVMLARVPVTASIASVIAVAGLLTAALVTLTVGKVQSTNDYEGSNEELLASSIAAKEAFVLAGGLAVAVVLVGIVGGVAAAWFATAALFGILASLFVSLLFAPAVYASVKTFMDGKPARDAYVGAKKTSAKQKKTYEKKAEPVAQEEAQAPAEAPVSESATESVAEEAPVEETPVETEETNEAVEEAPAEETPAVEDAE